MVEKYKTECIKRRRENYTFKQLYDLWIVWLDECNINAQEFYEKYKLEGSFIHWLEERKMKSGVK